jgi:uncharacterized protein YndB with AHSA1/START domain
MNTATATRMPEQQILVPQGQNYFQIIREYDAPRALVHACYTEPKHMVHFWGPHGGTVPECRIDLRVGGVWRVVMRFADGTEFGYSSVYTELDPPSLIAYRDAPDDWAFGLDGLPPPQLVSTIALEDLGKRTRVTVTVRCPSVEARDENVRRGFTGMVTQGNERLDTYLATLQQARP